MPKTTNKLWSSDEDLFLTLNYPLMPIKDICLKMERTRDSIVGRASGLKIKKIKRATNRVFDLNEDYFKEIDSCRKAYWYGFLWADGSLCDSSFEFSLQNRDSYILDQFKSDIESTHKIKPHCKYNTKRFLFSSKAFSEHLNNLNITNRKSYSTLTPVVPEEYFINFLLGLFDGDGSFTKVFCITCSPQVASWLKDEVYKKYGIEAKIYDIKGTHVKRFNIQKRFEIELIMDKLYEQNDFYLKRKREKYLNFKNRVQK